MATKRIASATWRGVLVALGLFLAVSSPLAAKEGPDALTVDRDLRRVLRESVPLPERLAAAQEALSGRALAEPPALVRAGLALLREAPDAGLWLVLAGRDADWLDEDLAAEAVKRLKPLLARKDAPAAARADWAAAALSVRYRPVGLEDAISASWPPSDAVLTVLRREVAPPSGAGATWPLGEKGAAEVASAVRASLVPARLLDQAERLDPAVVKDALDGLRTSPHDSLDLLLHEVREAVAGVPLGRIPRATRAVLVLGLLGNRAATPVLVDALNAPNGWVQAEAAVALGDLGDPAAAVALARKITDRGDVLRPRDQWDYPGERETTVPRDQWQTIEYFVTDVAAADSLLRMGFTGAIGWLIQKKLDPTLMNYRIRVLQDAVDALRRNVPSIPVDVYNIDAGIPQKKAAYETLEAWWREHRFDPHLLAKVPDADDPAFRTEVRHMVERMRGQNIQEFLVTQESGALLGAAATPVFLDALASSDNRVLRTEIARALGMIGDLKAVDALIGLVHDKASFIRATAAESLGAYEDADPRVEKTLIQVLDDPEAAPRVAALSQLVQAPPSPEFLAVLEKHSPDAHRRLFGEDDRDYRMAWNVAMLVQEGAGHWDEIQKCLVHEERYVRRASWDLLRRALRLPNFLYDPVKQPSDPDWTPVNEDRVMAALAARRGGK